MPNPTDSSLPPPISTPSHRTPLAAPSHLPLSPAPPMPSPASSPPASTQPSSKSPSTAFFPPSNPTASITSPPPSTHVYNPPAYHPIRAPMIYNLPRPVTTTSTAASPKSKIVPSATPTTPSPSTSKRTPTPPLPQDFPRSSSSASPHRFLISDRHLPSSHLFGPTTRRLSPVISSLLTTNYQHAIVIIVSPVDRGHEWGESSRRLLHYPRYRPFHPCPHPLATILHDPTSPLLRAPADRDFSSPLFA